MKKLKVNNKINQKKRKKRKNNQKIDNYSPSLKQCLFFFFINNKFPNII